MEVYRLLVSGFVRGDASSPEVPSFADHLALFPSHLLRNPIHQRTHAVASSSHLPSELFSLLCSSFRRSQTDDLLSSSASLRALFSSPSSSFVSFNLSLAHPLIFSLIIFFHRSTAESPRWLLANGRDDEAKAFLVRFHGNKVRFLFSSFDQRELTSPSPFRRTLIRPWLLSSGKSSRRESHLTDLTRGGGVSSVSTARVNETKLTCLVLLLLSFRLPCALQHLQR